MPQRQCPWCGRLGVRVQDSEIKEDFARPHADGSPCVCRHVNCANRKDARKYGGRYFDETQRRWVCLGGCK